MKQAKGLMEKLAFVTQAIKNLRKGESKGIHVVYSGFNEGFKKYYGEPARATVDDLVAKGKIVSRPCRGGIMIYLPEDAPKIEDRGAKALVAMGIK